MTEILEKYSLKIIYSYFLLSAINGCLAMIGFNTYAKLDLLIMLSGTFIMCRYLSKRIMAIDLFVLLFILSIALSSAFMNYDFGLWKEGCRNQLYVMQFYFVGKYLGTNNLKILNKGLWPFLITCIIALVLYVYSPSWYMNYKLSMWEDQLTEGRILEMTRLSGFWTYPYWISYGCVIMYVYVLNKSYVDGELNRQNKVILSFIFFIAVLTQQRAPLFMISAVTILYIVASQFVLKKKGRFIRFQFSIIQYLLLLFLTIVVVVGFMSDEMLLRLIYKIEVLQGKTEFIEDRASIFSDFYSKKISLFGDGIGKYSHMAFRLGKLAITDQQYMKILYETGYWGCFGYAFIMIYSLVKGLKSFRTYFFEYIILAFYLVAMTGSNCLCQFGLHDSIFWICCGRISKATIREKKRVNTVSYKSYI